MAVIIRRTIELARGSKKIASTLTTCCGPNQKTIGCPTRNNLKTRETKRNNKACTLNAQGSTVQSTGFKSHRNEHLSLTFQQQQQQQQKQ